jgi:hypothetical protein
MKTIERIFGRVMEEHLETPKIDMVDYRRKAGNLSRLLTDRIYYLDNLTYRYICKAKVEENPKLRTFYQYLIDSYEREKTLLSQER